MSIKKYELCINFYQKMVKDVAIPDHFSPREILAYGYSLGGNLKEDEVLKCISMGYQSAMTGAGFEPANKPFTVSDVFEDLPFRERAILKVHERSQ